MNVKLRVLQGLKAGMVFRIAGLQFRIGRSQDCDLQPKSEAISRHHCLVSVRAGKVFVRDLNSRNGTFVNGRQVAEDCELQCGDRLQIGLLVFEIHIDDAVAGGSRPPLAAVTETTQGTRGHDHTSGPGDASTVAEWLDEADELARLKRLSSPDTHQLKREETVQVELEQASDLRMEERWRPEASAGSNNPSSAKTRRRTESLNQGSPVIGKLPPRPEKASKDSGQAAALALKRFFERRWSA